MDFLISRLVHSLGVLPSHLILTLSFPTFCIFLSVLDSTFPSSHSSYTTLPSSLDGMLVVRIQCGIRSLGDTIEDSELGL
jgi:hypothetical protein